MKKNVMNITKQNKNHQGGIKISVELLLHSLKKNKETLNKSTESLSELSLGATRNTGGSSSLTVTIIQG